MPGGWASAFVLVLTGGVMAAVVMELAVRTATHVVGACHPVCITQYDPRLGWTNAPGSVGRHREPALGIDVTYRIDAGGTRASLVHHEPRPGAPRVLVLGDSNGFGWGVADDQHFGARLSRSGIAVLNLSVSGYGTDQSLLRFLSDGIRFRPHLVVLQSTPNDFDDNQRTLVGGRPKPRFALEGSGLRLQNVPVEVQPQDAAWLVGGWLPLAHRAWLGEHSYFYAWLNDRWQRRKTQREPPPRFSTESVALFRALVEEIRSSAAARGAALVLVHASSDIRQRQSDAIPAGVHVLDLSEAFGQAGGTMFADNLHWNDEGHRLVAERIARWMTEHDLRTEPVSPIRD